MKRKHRQIYVLYRIQGHYFWISGVYYGVIEIKLKDYQNSLKELWKHVKFKKKNPKPFTFNKYIKKRDKFFRWSGLNGFRFYYNGFDNIYTEEYGYDTGSKMKESIIKCNNVEIIHISSNKDYIERKRKELIKTYNTVTRGFNLPEDIDYEDDFLEGEGTYCVYAHTSPNGKKYIGMTKNGENPNKRWQNGNGYITQRKFYNAIKKYGWDNFRHEILKNNLNFSSACYWEMYYIRFYKTDEKGYNVLSGEYDILV